MHDISPQKVNFLFAMQEGFLDFGRDPSQFPNFSSLEGLVSYKPISYKQKECSIGHLPYVRG